MERIELPNCKFRGRHRKCTIPSSRVLGSVADAEAKEAENRSAELVPHCTCCYPMDELPELPSDEDEPPVPVQVKVL